MTDPGDIPMADAALPFLSPPHRRPGRRHTFGSSLILIPLLLVLAFLPVGCAGPTELPQGENGHFVGKVRTEWLDDGRNMVLLAGFEYVDPAGVRWIAPEGCVINGASIPRIAWSYPGGPYTGKYRNASAVHDIACEKPRSELDEKCWGRHRPHTEVHRMFYDAMLTGGVPEQKAQLMYFFVRTLGPRWDIDGNEVASPFDQDEQEVLVATERSLHQVLDTKEGERPMRLSAVDDLYRRELAVRPGVNPTEIPTRDQMHRRINVAARDLKLFASRVEATGRDRVNRTYVIARSIVDREDLGIEELEVSLDSLLEGQESAAGRQPDGRGRIPVDP